MIWPKSVTATAGLALDAIRNIGALIDAAVVAAQDVFGGEDDE